MAAEGAPNTAIIETCIVAYREAMYPPVIYLHGYNFTHRIWLETGATKPAEENNLSWAAPDMPYGRRTSCSEKTRSIEKNIAVIEKTLELLTRKPDIVHPILVAASMGARYALAYAARRKLAGLVLVAPALGTKPQPLLQAASKNLAETPVLVLIGTRDSPRFKLYAKKAAEALPNTKLVEVADAGHVIHRDNPKEFKRHLQQYFNELLAR
jgi:pimeloyl-ACP methyl ester carboxylesterase